MVLHHHRCWWPMTHFRHDLQRKCYHEAVKDLNMNHIQSSHQGPHHQAKDILPQIRRRNYKINNRWPQTPRKRSSHETPARPDDQIWLQGQPKFSLCDTQSHEGSARDLSVTPKRSKTLNEEFGSRTVAVCWYWSTSHTSSVPSTEASSFQGEWSTPRGPLPAAHATIQQTTTAWSWGASMAAVGLCWLQGGAFGSIGTDQVFTSFSPRNLDPAGRPCLKQLAVSVSCWSPSKKMIDEEVYLILWGNRN